MYAKTNKSVSWLHSPFAYLTIVFVCFALLAGEFFTFLIEREFRERTLSALTAVGFSEITVEMDGTIPTLGGKVASRAERKQAIELAARIAGVDHVPDDLQIMPEAPLEKTEYRVELHRDEDRIAIIGLIPDEALGSLLVENAHNTLKIPNVEHLLSLRVGEAKEGWREMVLNVSSIMGDLTIGSAIISEHSLSVDGFAQSVELSSQIKQQIVSTIPEGIVPQIEIMVPPPVVVPYYFSAQKQAGSIYIHQCHAPDVMSQQAIVSKADSLNIKPIHCQLANGAPNAKWHQAVIGALEFISKLESANIVIRDEDVIIIDVELSPDQRDELIALIPPAYNVSNSSVPIGEKPEQPIGSTLPYEIYMSLQPKSRISISGKVPDKTSLDTMRALANALFTAHEFQVKTLDNIEGSASSWSLAAIAAIKTLAKMHNGTANIDVTGLSIRGEIIGANNACLAAAELRKIDKDISVESNLLVTHDRIELTGIEIESTYTPEQCVDQLNRKVMQTPFSFEPASASISPKDKKVVQALANILSKCDSNILIEVGGHTDSSGSDRTNLKLSNQRSLAVRNAIMAAGAKEYRLFYRGYGENKPIADNSTAEGRQKNRRIEFKLMEGL